MYKNSLIFQPKSTKPSSESDEQAKESITDYRNRSVSNAVEAACKAKITLPTGTSNRASVNLAREKFEKVSTPNTSENPEQKKPPTIPNKPGKLNSVFLQNNQSPQLPRKQINKFERAPPPVKLKPPTSVVPGQFVKKLEQKETSSEQNPKIVIDEPIFETGSGNSESVPNSYEGDDKSISSKGSGDSSGFKMELENKLKQKMGMQPTNVCKDDPEDQIVDELYSELPSGPDNLNQLDEKANQNEKSATVEHIKAQSKLNLGEFSVDEDSNDLYACFPSSQSGLDDGTYGGLYGGPQDIPPATSSKADSNCDTLQVYADAEEGNVNDVYDEMNADLEPTEASGSKDSKRVGGGIKGIFRKDRSRPAKK